MTMTAPPFLPAPRCTFGVENTVDSRQAVSSHRSVWIHIVKTVGVRSEEQSILLVDLIVDAKKRHPICVVADEYSRIDRRNYGGAAILAAIFS